MPNHRLTIVFSSFARYGRISQCLSCWCILRLTLVDRLRAVSVHPDKEVFTEQLSMASTAVECPVSVITSLCLS